MFCPPLYLYFLHGCWHWKYSKFCAPHFSFDILSSGQKHIFHVLSFAILEPFFFNFYSSVYLLFILLDISQFKSIWISHRLWADSVLLYCYHWNQLSTVFSFGTKNGASRQVRHHAIFGITQPITDENKYFTYIQICCLVGYTEMAYIVR